MGRTTYESIGRPLPGPHHHRAHPRPGLVRRRRAGRPRARRRRSSSADDLDGDVMVAGGAQVYADALPLADRPDPHRGARRARGRHPLPGLRPAATGTRPAASTHDGVRPRLVDAADPWQADGHGAADLHRAPAGRDLRRPARGARRPPRSSASARSSGPTTTSAMGTDGLPGPTDAWITLAGLARETSHDPARHADDLGHLPAARARWRSRWRRSTR